MAREYMSHWDQKFRAQEWGKYPPEDLVRFIGRYFKSLDKSQIKVLEVGCGAGANLWFLHREGFCVFGIDGSLSGIEKTAVRLKSENKSLNTIEPELKTGDFSKLPWNDSSFDIVIDIFSVYANTLPVIRNTISEINRVLKPHGRFYSKLWGKECAGYGTGIELELGTYDQISEGPCQNMGVSHFFDREEIQSIFSAFDVVSIDEVRRTDRNGKVFIHEFLCHFTKRPL